MVDYLVTVSTLNSLISSIHFRSDNKAIIYAILVICLAIHVAAIVDASRGKGASKSYSADVILSVLSPVMYWILKAFGVIGADKVKA